MIQNVRKLSEILQQHAEKIGNQTAYVFLKDGENEEVRITYKELDLKARAFAANLLRIAKPGERALLLYPSGLEYIVAFIGCIYAGIVAAPTTVPHLKRATPRLSVMSEDAQATIACTDKALFQNIQLVLGDYQVLNKLNWIVSEDIDDNLASKWRDPNVSAEDICFLQYTSGSTSSPKGVMISHRNLIRTIEDIFLGGGYDKDSVMVSWLPIFHDMGLIFGLLTPLYAGCPCYFMSPVSFLEKPSRWLNMFSKYSATHTAAPNFAYEVCTRKISKDEKSSINLSKMRYVLNGAEPVRLETMVDFANYFQDCGFNYNMFVPGYGLAEATVKVSAKEPNNSPAYCVLDTDELEKNRLLFLPKDQNGYKLVGCGWSSIGADIKIVNPQTKTESPTDEIGEIWVQSESVAQGYWDKPKESEETFRAYIANTNQGPYLRTGDMGFIYQGELYIAGRIKDMVIIQGKNYYPQDIELTAENSHEGLRPSCSAAFALESEDGEKLVVVQEVKREFRKNTEDFEKMGNAIRLKVAKHHGLRVNSVILIMPSTISKTTSGKIQRSAVKQSFINKTLETLYEWHAPDKK